MSSSDGFIVLLVCDFLLFTVLCFLFLYVLFLFFSIVYIVFTTVYMGRFAWNKHDCLSCIVRDEQRIRASGLNKYLPVAVRKIKTAFVVMLPEKLRLPLLLCFFTCVEICH